MLDYLVTSEVRRKLLKVLWAERLSGAVSELARLAGVGFASAHAELRHMAKAGFAVSKKVGNTRVYAANCDHPQAAVLRALLSNEVSVTSADRHDLAGGTDKDTLLNLSRWGAPLGAGGKPELQLPLEATLARGLRLAHNNATVARVLPVVFFKGRERLDFERLRFLAGKLDEERALGFFLDLTAELSGDMRFHKHARALRDRRYSLTHDFFVAVQGRRARELAEANTPAVAKKWRLRMNMGFDSFESLFRKFVEVTA